MAMLPVRHRHGRNLTVLNPSLRPGPGSTADRSSNGR